jgi:SAM-dependent methyltransferase
MKKREVAAVERGKQAPLRWRVVRPLFELLYRNRALYWLASTIPFAGQWRTWQRLALPRLAGRDVLEVGCGIGTLLADMARAGYRCQAIDRSPQMAAAARDRLRRQRIPPGAAAVTVGDARRLPFADASFDSAVSTFPTEYIFDRAALREIARVLRPGGQLVIVLGAALLPASLPLLPFVAIQSLVYGRRPTARTSMDMSARTGSSARDALIALLAEAGLSARREVVRGPFWEAYLYIAQKSDDPA